ncbi:hypothetical protein [Marinobacter zhanjiangensis]|uniref:Lipoprotein n=1 Tax=Marinobacter zhanjiangensis TaxID=578215 RepID=A0ABQ3AU42_9GAMM|nr:hypothetical protein [Marinobacter zhanjiangensis]GGY66132.1 hypothetical protein GCM10007071_11150 [Marinobacter zhanjiangensis]
MNLAQLLRGTTLGLALSIAGCAGTPEQKPTNAAPLQVSYQEMAADLNADPSFATYEKHLSRKLSEDMEPDLGPDPDEHVEFLSPPFWYEEVRNFHEGTRDGKQCLTVNGISVDGDPISAGIEYVDEQGQKKIRAVEIALFEQVGELPLEVWCPVRPDEI